MRPEVQSMASLKKRGTTYYLQYYVGSQQRRVNLKTESYQIAKEKARQFESAQARGDANPLPTKTPLADILEKFVKFLETFKTAKSLQTDVYYLRAMFGAICPALKITSRRRGPRIQKRPDIPHTFAAVRAEPAATAALCDLKSGPVFVARRCYSIVVMFK